MDNVLQTYTDGEDAMFTAAHGLLTGMNMQGAIPFKDFPITFSTTKFLKGFYNVKEGDIYAKSTLTIRGDHSRVAAR